MPRYEFSEGTSNKFWEITLEGTGFKTTYGKIGTPGTSTLKDFGDAAKAQKEYDKLIGEKTKKGYSLVGDDAPSPAPAAKKAAPAAAPAAAAKKAAPAKKAASGGPTAALDADPNDAQAWAVYADFLQSNGDPRGELATVQEQLLANPKDKNLLSAEKKLLKEHAEMLVGKLLPFIGKSLPSVTARPELGPEARQSSGNEDPIRIRWRAGHIVGATVSYGGYDWSPGGGGEDDEGGGDEGGERDVADMLATLLANPSARFLTDLKIGMPNNPEDGECDTAPVITRLAANDEACGRIRKLYLGDIAQEESEVSWIFHGTLAKLLPKMKNLESLTIRGGDFTFGPLDLPNLKELVIVTGGLKKKNLDLVCKAKWPALEKLEIWFGSNSYGADTKLKDVQPIFDGTNFPAVTTLGLKNCEFVNEIAEAISSAKILPRLKALELSKGVLHTRGVQAMVAKKAAFAHLTRIDLSDNFLDASAMKLASTIIPQVRTKPQRNTYGEDTEDNRYVALGE
ncbi:MAG: WGR domain-containing protein [Archangium sp.]|nr:WGR domain-containing protein [Archangium sp.]